MATLSQPRERMSRYQRRSLLMGLLFVSPWLIGFLGFTVYPLISSIYFSMTRYDFIRPPVFIGLGNYINLFTSDPHFYNVLYNTIYYVGFSVPLSLVFAFSVANLLNSKIVGRSFFRAVAYIPSIVPAVCSAMIWLFLMNIQYGAINGVLQALHMQTIPFLSSPTLAKPSIILIAAWASGGAVVIFLASLQDVPRHLYEAAMVDGANAWQRFLNVTIPMTTPVILFNLLMGFIGAFQEFTLPWLLTQGGPMNSTEFYAVNLYRVGFMQLGMGKASAMAWILFVVIIVFTVLLFKTSARWVYYGGGEK